MATNLNELWFTAIEKNDIPQLTLLMFSTPNLQMGQKRLSLTLTPNDKLFSPIQKQLKESSFTETLGSSIDGIDSVSLVILMMALNGVETYKKTLNLLLCIATPENLNSKWGDGNTCLHVAACAKQDDIIVTLLKRKANPYIINDHGFSSPLKSIHKTNIETPSTLHSNELDEIEDLEKKRTLKKKVNDPILTKNESTRKEDGPNLINLAPLVETKIETTQVEVKKVEHVIIETKPEKEVFPDIKADSINSSCATELSPKFSTSKLEIDSKKSFPNFPVKTLSKTQDRKVSFSKIPFESKRCTDSEPIFKFTKANGVERKSVEDDSTLSKLYKQESISTHNNTDIGSLKIEDANKKNINNSLLDLENALALDHLVQDICDKGILKNENDEVDVKPGTPEIKDEPHVIETSEIETSKMSSKQSLKSNKDFKDYYKTLYANHLKQPEFSLIDEPNKNSSPGKNVHFGNSWRGNLETKRMYSETAMISSLGRSDIKNVSHQFNEKMIVKLSKLQGLVIDMNKVPEESHIYCIVKFGNGQEFSTKKISICSQNQFTDIPIYQDFSTNCCHENITVDLHLRCLYPKTNKFNPKKMIARGTGTIRRFFGSKSTLVKKHEKSSLIESDSTIGRIHIPIREVEPRCDGKIFERKWSWQVVESEENNGFSRDNDGRSTSASFYETIRSPSRMMSNLFLGTDEDKKSNDFQIVETGVLDMEFLTVKNLESETEYQTVPNSTHEAFQWTQHKKWHNTIWQSGYLSQQGGDLKYWKRRFFKIIGSKMNAYHELNNSYRVSFDLTQLVSVEPMTIESDMTVFPTKNSFILRFKHGEFIEFYADSHEECMNWVNVLLKLIDEMPEKPSWLGEEDGNWMTNDDYQNDHVKVPGINLGMKKQRANVSQVNWGQNTNLQRNIQDRKLTPSPKKAFPSKNQQIDSKKMDTNSEEIDFLFNNDSTKNKGISPVGIFGTSSKSKVRVMI